MRGLLGDGARPVGKGVAYRDLTMRRLDNARHLIRSGAGLADAAMEAGFADQSHMTRQFNRAYGLPPRSWRYLLVQGGRQR